MWFTPFLFIGIVASLIAWVVSIAAVTRPTRFRGLIGLSVLLLVLGWAPLGASRALAYNESRQLQRYWQEAQLAFDAKWKDVKDSDGTPIAPPAILGMSRYPDRAVMFLYRAPTGSTEALVWLSNPDNPQVNLRDIWIPVAVQQAVQPSTVIPTAIPEREAPARVNRVGFLGFPCTRDELEKNKADCYPEPTATETGSAGGQSQ